MGLNAPRSSADGPVATQIWDGWYERQWFADEVVVDFPSLAPAVDRIRHAFEAEHATSRAPALIRLSTGEARGGATASLEVPVSTTCRVCGGRGGTWVERCTCCGGHGTEMRSHRVQVRVPAGVRDGARFHFSLTPEHDAPTRIELRVLVG